MVGLRERKRLATMREVQQLAVQMFVSDGWHETSVGDVARAAGISESTVYRHFGTKERLVLWDEHDPAVDAALGRAFAAGGPVLGAVRDALAVALGSAYDAQRGFQVTRWSYVFETEELHAAALGDEARQRAELASALTRFLPKPDRRHAPTLAAFCLAALSAAVASWVADAGRDPLGDRIIDAFDAVTVAANNLT